MAVGAITEAEARATAGQFQIPTSAAMGPAQYSWTVVT